MYRPKRIVSRRRAGRILRGIYACLFAALVIMCLPVPGKRAYASGAGKVFPVDAFNGEWDYGEASDATTHTLTIQLQSDGTATLTRHLTYPADEVFKNGQVINDVWSGTYTYDSKTGELITNTSFTFLTVIDLQPAEDTWTETDRFILIDSHTLEHKMLVFNGNQVDPPSSIYYRLSDTPYNDDEEEGVDQAGELESIEEPSEEDSSEEETDETEETVSDEESQESEEASAGSSEETGDVADQEQDVTLTDEEAEKLLISVFEGDDEHLDRFKTAATAVGMTLGGFVSALLATGTMGGGPTPPTAGEGGAVSGSVDPGSLGQGVTIDSDGDIHYRNPFNGQESVYLSNGDGTYRNALTGAQVTIKDINDRADYEFDNASEIGLEQEKLDAWKEQQREANNQLSQEARQAAIDKDLQEKYLQEQDRINKIMYKRGVFDGNTKEFKKKILEERQVESQKFGEYAAAGDYWDAATKTAENVKKGADIAIDVMAEIEPTGAGKSIKNGYKFLSEAAAQGGECMAGKQSLKQAIGKTLVNGGLNYVKDNIPNNEYSNELKCLANVTGNGTAEYINARVIDGKTHEQALQKASDAAKEGLAEFAIDYGVGKVMDGVTEGIEIRDNKVYNGLYNNNNVTGTSISKLGLKSQKSGFTKAVVKNDRYKEGASSLVSGLIKLALPDDDD